MKVINLYNKNENKIKITDIIQLGEISRLSWGGSRENCLKWFKDNVEYVSEADDKSTNDYLRTTLYGKAKESGRGEEFLSWSNNCHSSFQMVKTKDGKYYIITFELALIDWMCEVKVK